MVESRSGSTKSAAEGSHKFSAKIDPTLNAGRTLPNSTRCINVLRVIGILGKHQEFSCIKYVAETSLIEILEVLLALALVLVLALQDNHSNRSSRRNHRHHRSRRHNHLERRIISEAKMVRIVTQPEA